MKYLLSILCLFVLSCEGSDFGCTVESACNYDPNAILGNGSCYYCYDNDCDTYPEDEYDCDGNCLLDENCIDE